MNTNLKIKKSVAKALFAIAITLIPLHNIHAQKSSDDFGIWGTFEFSQKVNKKTKFVIDAEVRSIEAVSDIERIAVGAKLDYKIKEWKDLGLNFYDTSYDRASILDSIIKNFALSKF